MNIPVYYNIIANYKFSFVIFSFDVDYILYTVNPVGITY